MQRRRKTALLIACAVVLCVAAACLLPRLPAPVKNPWTQEYLPGAPDIKGNVDREKYESVSADFSIGADKNGYAVFKEPHRAFRTFKRLYADGLRLIRRENSLLPISRLTYGAYKIYGGETSGGDAEEQAQADFAGGFLDIYENSFAARVPASGSDIPAA